MARLTALLAFLALSLLISNAFAHRTTVEVDEDNQGRYERCRQQGGRQQLQSCQRYLMQQSRDVIQMRGIDDENRSELMDQCCQQLRRVDEQCRCEQLKELVYGQQRRQMSRREEEQMTQKARNLPSMCGLQRQRCDF